MTEPVAAVYRAKFADGVEVFVAALDSWDAQVGALTALPRESKELARLDYVAPIDYLMRNLLGTPTTVTTEHVQFLEKRVAAAEKIVSALRKLGPYSDGKHGWGTLGEALEKWNEVD